MKNLREVKTEISIETSRQERKILNNRSSENRERVGKLEKVVFS